MARKIAWFSGQFNPGFQFQRGQVQGQRAGFGKVDQRPRMALAALIGGDGQLSDIQRMRFRCQEDAGQGRVPMAQISPLSACWAIFSAVSACMEDGGSIRPSI